MYEFNYHRPSTLTEASDVLADQDEATLLDKGEHRLREFLKSDLALIYHPAELAIKALQASVKSQDKEGASSSSLKQKLDDFLNDVFGSQQAELGRLAKVCKEIESDGKAFSKQLLKGEKLEAEATRIMAKLKDCCNPATERRHPWHVQICISVVLCVDTTTLAIVIPYTGV